MSVSKIGQAGIPSISLPNGLMNVLMNGFQNRRPSRAPVAEQRAVRPQRDVDDHQAAVDEGQDVDELAPATEAEPGLLVRPAAEPGREDAGVAHEVGDVDQAGRRDRDGDGRPRTDDEDRQGGDDADRRRPRWPACGSACSRDPTCRRTAGAGRGPSRTSGGSRRPGWPGCRRRPRRGSRAGRCRRRTGCR